MPSLRRHLAPDLAVDLARQGDENVISLWWLGQAGFALRAGGLRLVIDPYLSDSLARKYAGTAFPHRRMMPPPFSPETLTAVDLVLCTHGHTDHMDADTLTAIAATAPSCRFVVPAADATRAVDRGAPDNRLIRADAECEIVPFPGLSILPLPSAHETLKTDAAGSHFYLGYVISWRGLTLYHSGDCVPYPGLLERLHAGHVDLALLPVNGRDATRLSNGVPGNFHLREAIALCRDADIPLMLGHHFGLFDFNTIDEPTARQELEAEHAGFDLVEAGVRYDLIRS